MQKMTLFLVLAVLLCITSKLSGSELIKSVTINNNSIRVVAGTEFHDAYLTQDFFADYTSDYDLSSLDYSIATIPFIMNVMPIVWISDKTYTIDSMDYDLYHSLLLIQKVFQLFYPSKKWAGTLVPKKLVKNSITPHHGTAAVLFSHGLDAVYSSLHNGDKKQLLITVCGGDIGLSKPVMWSNVQNKCKQFAHSYGHQNAFVRSNFNTFRNFKHLRTLTPEIKNWFGLTSQGLGYTGLAAPVAYRAKCPFIVLASTRTSDHPYAYGTHPLIDNSIAFGGIRVHHDGPEVNRLEKIREISALCTHQKKPKPFLRVCWGNDPEGGNCTTCEKCFRTIVELLIEGEKPQDYGFNISLEQALSTARKNIPGKKKLNEGLLWHWHCIKTAAQQKLDAGLPLSADKRIYDFMQWITTFDFARFSSPYNKKRSEAEKIFFTTLWKKSVNGTFTQADLQQYPMN